MTQPIEDYALLGDLHTAALVGRDGSIDWLCFPRFDSPALFAAILGGPENGHWRIAPAGEVARSSRAYQEGTFILETEWETADGAVRVTDAMPTKDRRADVVRRVEGLRGSVRMRQELIVRFGYGAIMPWVRRHTEDDGSETILMIAGPDALQLRGSPLPKAADHRHIGEFDVPAGSRFDFQLTWYASHRPAPSPLDVDAQLAATSTYWTDWVARCEASGRYAHAVKRSLLVLRALTHEDTGGIVAAATTSLPESLGGERNWDYRFCWLRDAALTLQALLEHGYVQEAQGWRRWLLRAMAGDPEDLQIMYGLAGERDLVERELAHLPGYAGSRPVRIGNGAVDQYQSDVFGEVMVALDQARAAGLEDDSFSWPLQRALLADLEERIARPDHGLWEVRGPQRFFTHSRVMIWAALDRGVRAVTEHGMHGPAKRWTALRDRVRGQVLTRGWDAERRTFVQYLDGQGEAGVDAALLAIAQVGLLPWDDERVLGTVAAIERELIQDGLVNRYVTSESVDGLRPGENPFLACTFWLAEQYAHTGRLDDAVRTFDRGLATANDLGLLAEEYDPAAGRMMGNFPQAFSHLALVRAADAIHQAT